MNGFNEVGLKDRILNVWYKNKKYIIIFLFVVVLLTIVLTIVLNNKDRGISKYSSIESIMIYNAQGYIKNNSIDSDIYIPLNYLNIKIDDSLGCNSNSGVLKEDDEYMPYLICSSYKSNIIQEILDENELNKDYGNLKGDNPYILTTEEYQEQGIELAEGYTVNIKNNDIDNGINIVKYNILKENKYISSLKRIVIAEKVIGSLPIIELVGNTTRTININTPYIESGYSATDKIDGNITNKVTVKGSVDITKAGVYTLTYSVTNTRGKIATEKRKIIVNDNNVDLDIKHTLNPSTITSNGVTITLNMNNNGYKYTILPNGEKVSTTPAYTVYKNGSYEFIVYDKNENSEVYVANIKNIDSLPPTGTCKAEFKDDVTTFTVKASDVSGIKSYEYISNDASLKTTSKENYSHQTYPVNPKVKITDNSLESATISCEVTNLSPKYYTSEVPLKIKTHSNGMRYYLYLPKNIDVREKAPLIIALHGGQGRHCNRIDGKYQYVPYDTWITYPYIYSMINKGNNYPAIILFPERINCNWPRSGDFKLLNQLIDTIISTYNIDKNKISMLGHSQGGAGTIGMIVDRPNFLSVALIISPAGTGSFSKEKLQTSAWFIVADSEYVNIRTYVREFKTNLTASGLADKFRFTEFLDSNHETDDRLFSLAGAETINWMISQTKGQPIVFDDTIASKLNARSY